MSRGSENDEHQLRRLGTAVALIGFLVLLASSIGPVIAQSSTDITLWRAPKDVTDLTSDADGNAWGLLSPDGAVFRLQPDNSAFTWWDHTREDVFGRLPSAAVYENGLVWFVGDNSRVNNLDPDTGLVTGWEAGFGDIRHIAVDDAGNAWFNAGFSTCRINTSAEERTCWPTDARPGDGIAVDQDGHGWYTRAITRTATTPGSTLGEINPTTGEIREWQVVSGLVTLYGTLAVDNSGHIWTAAASHGSGSDIDARDGQLVRLNPDTGQVDVHTCPLGCRLARRTIGSSGLDVPTEIELDSTGRVWFAESRVDGRAIFVGGGLNPQLNPVQYEEISGVQLCGFGFQVDTYRIAIDADGSHLWSTYWGDSSIDPGTGECLRSNQFISRVATSLP